MSKLTFGKVESYDPVERKLDALWLPPAFTWKEGRVRTSGSHVSECDVTSREFDVTITPETAAKLVSGFVFSLVYEDEDEGDVKRVTKFAGQVIPAVPSSSAALAVSAASSTQPPAGSSSSPPQQ